MNITKIRRLAFASCSFLLLTMPSQILGGVPPSDAVERSEQLGCMAKMLIERSDDRQIKCLFLYANSFGVEGQNNLLDLIASVRVPSKYARWIFDLLLASPDKKVVTDTLNTLTIHYPWICKAKEKTLLIELTKRHDKDVSELAAGTLKEVERHASMNRDFEPYKGRNY